MRRGAIADVIVFVRVSNMADSSSVLIPEATGEVVTGLGVESDEDETVPWRTKVAAS